MDQLDAYLNTFDVLLVGDSSLHPVNYIIAQLFKEKSLRNIEGIQNRIRTMEGYENLEKLL